MKLTMELIVPLIILLNVGFIKGTGTKCNKNPVCKNVKFLEHYKDINCRPLYYKHDPCPHCYDCPVLTSMVENPDKCYFHNQVLNIGDNTEQIGQNCIASCACAERADGQPAELVCAVYDCARPPDDCRPIFSLDSCCPVGYDCDNPNPKTFTCTKEGMGYHLGEVFILKSNPCVRCVCKNNGIVECKNINCNLQLYNSNYLKQYCAPIYYAESCCPSDFLCPGNGVTIINKPSLNTLSGKTCTCKFGENTLPIGSIITVQDRPCLKCECTTPPLVTCYEDPECKS